MSSSASESTPEASWNTGSCIAAPHFRICGTTPALPVQLSLCVTACAAWVGTARGSQPETALAQLRSTVRLAFSVCAFVGNVGVPSTVGSFAAAALSRVPSCAMASMRTGRA